MCVVYQHIVRVLVSHTETPTSKTKRNTKTPTMKKEKNEDSKGGAHDHTKTPIEMNKLNPYNGKMKITRKVELEPRIWRTESSVLALSQNPVGG